MKVKMLKAVKIATDGIGHEVDSYKVGDIAELEDKLAHDFIDCELAEEVKAEQKKVVAAPDNKKLEKAPKTGGK